MNSTRPYLLLLIGCCLALTQSVLSQTMSNTDNTITLTSTCLNPTLASGTYNLSVYYVWDGGTPTINISGVTVVSNGTTATITAPAGSFPTVATNFISLATTYNGTLSLTGGPTPCVMYWAQFPDGSLELNCVALPIWFNSFSGFQSGSSVILNWQTGLEQNTSVIEIYRSSTTGGSYYKIGQVTAAGNSSIPVNYNFTDVNAGASDYYYLKMLNSVGQPAIYSSTIHVLCSGCIYTPPAAVNCPYTINGPDHICTTGVITPYNLSGAVPNYSTINWAVSNPAGAGLHVYSDFDPRQVSLLEKSGGGIYLTATLSGCTNVISKFIVVGTPAPTISTTLSCPELYGYAGNSPGATNYQWHVVDLTTFTETITNTTSASMNAYIGGGHSWNIGFQYTNVCGNSVPAVQYGFVCQSGGSGGHVIKLSPNPSNGVVSIGLTSALAPVDGISPGGTVIHTSGNVTPAYAGTGPAGSKTATTVDAQVLSRTTPNSFAFSDKPKVYQVKVVDASGTVRKAFNYPDGVENVSVNLSGLINGIYTIQVYDNKTWTSSQVVLTK